MKALKLYQGYNQVTQRHEAFGFKPICTVNPSDFVVHGVHLTLDFAELQVLHFSIGSIECHNKPSKFNIDMCPMACEWNE